MDKPRFEDRITPPIGAIFIGGIGITDYYYVPPNDVFSVTAQVQTVHRAYETVMLIFLAVGHSELADKLRAIHAMESRSEE